MKLVKIIQEIISYLLLITSILLFVPPVLIWALSQYILDPKGAIAVIKEVIKQLRPEQKTP